MIEFTAEEMAAFTAELEDMGINIHVDMDEPAAYASDDTRFLSADYDF